MSRNRPLSMPLEETGIVLLPERLEPPLDWGGVFGRDAPVEIEIGSGKGLFLLEASRIRPEADFLGVERAAKWFHRSVERLLRYPRPNVRVVRTDAFDLLARWVPAASVAAVHVYFPDPWPKKRHAKRRLLQEPLYRLAARVLAPAGSFFVASDVEPYFDEAVAGIRATGLFTPVDWPSDAPDRLPTNYARKYEREGRPLHYARFARAAGLADSGDTADPASRSAGRDREEEMQR